MILLLVIISDMSDSLLTYLFTVKNLSEFDLKELVIVIYMRFCACSYTRKNFIIISISINDSIMLLIP